MLGFKSYETATSILSGVEAMHMLKKGQLHQQVMIFALGLSNFSKGVHQMLLYQVVQLKSY